MPITGYSSVFTGELDVEQMIKLLMQEDPNFDITKMKEIPEQVRSIIKADVQCPSCFVTGAEVISSAKSKDGASIRQPYFRFTTPGHDKLCDFAGLGPKETPENCISFGKSRGGVTEMVRSLVCSAIHLGIVNQDKIRDMRKWFHGVRRKSTIFVDIPEELTDKLLKWYRELSLGQQVARILPVELTTEMAKLPKFDWKRESRKQLYNDHQKLLEDLHAFQFGRTHHIKNRVIALLKRHHNQEVTDPTVLEEHYKKTIQLAEFIADYFGLKGSGGFGWIWQPNVASLVAFSALLLFVNEWDLSKGLDDFSRVVREKNPPQDLGNVMGLNPFHDYVAWSVIKGMQSLPLEVRSINSVAEDLMSMEKVLRERFQFRS